ncbi:MAG: hydroxypyruvate isomerase, partial [Rhodopirellula sp. JB044]
MSHPEDSVSRRSLLSRSLATAAGAATLASAGSAVAAESVADAPAPPSADAKKGRLNQSVCKWCYRELSLEEMCQAATKFGLVGIDLLGPDDFPTLKKHGLVCTMVSSHSLANGLCDT